MNRRQILLADDLIKRSIIVEKFMYNFTWLVQDKYPDEASKVKSMGGYSAFILGEATKEWVYNYGHQDSPALRL